MNRLGKWAKQPTTLLALALAAAAAVYWFTGSSTAAGFVAVTILGSVNDQTKTVLSRIEALEDTLRPATSLLGATTLLPPSGDK